MTIKMPDEFPRDKWVKNKCKHCGAINETYCDKNGLPTKVKRRCVCSITLPSQIKLREDIDGKNEYKCAKCGGIFESEEDWTEEKRWEEHDRNFPGESHETVERVCDDCYKKMIGIEPPPGMKAKQEIEDAMKVAQLAAFPPIAMERWWWKLLHPIKTRTIKKWMRETEPVMKQKLEQMNFNKLIEEMLCDQLMYGTSVTLIPGGKNEVYGRSPLYAALDEIRKMTTGKRRAMVNAHWEEVCKDILETSFPRIQPINMATRDHVSVKPWSLKMDIKEKP